MQSSRSARSIDTSSMTTVVSVAYSSGRRGLRRLARTFSGVASMPKPKNRCTVWPPTLSAATPVGASTTGVRRVFAR